jgi:hypothetical protein
MKSKNNRENHKNYHNQSLGVGFLKSKDPTVEVPISWLILEKQPSETPINI